VHSIASVIVTFNPEGNIAENIRRISGQSLEVFVIDNNSEDANFMDSLPKNCKIIRCKENIGLASALNIGVLNAIAAGHEWVATFDQDSLVPEDYFDRMLCDAKSIKRLSIGILSPLYFNPVSGGVKSFSHGEKSKVSEKYNIVKVTMTSGSIMSSDAIKHCGVFDDRMFIDQLDNEICLRYRRSGYSILENQEVMIQHSVGEVSVKRFMNIRLHPSNHNAFRRYYIARNRIYVYKRYLLFDPMWAILDAGAWVRETVKVVVFESEKKIKILNTLLGIRDGFMGRMGPKGK